MESQISNKSPGSRRTSNRYYTNKTVTCRSCNKTGHLSKNCPTPRKLPSCSLCGSQNHLQRTCPNRHCPNCSLPGHGYDDCLERAYWHKQCHRCGMTGHFYDACPEIWRQYHLTTKKGPILKPDGEVAHRNPAYCYNCSRQGHFGFECNQRRMFNGTYPTTPYISHYDTPQEVRRREHRARKKAQELREAGLLQPTELEKTVWPQGGDREVEPPRKKLKHNKGWDKKKRKDETTPAKASKAEKQPQQKTRTLKEKRKDRRSGKERRQLKKQQREAQTQQRQGGQRATWGAEEEDFPRGPKIRTPGAPTPPQKGKPSPGLFSSGKRSRKRRARGRDRKPGNRKLEAMYPSDENLFIIKQRRKP
ncbi:hypothetical protein MATL_G00224780 [Megalops atlanticus]|uniref:Zinc finger CCHC domain-containing protein 7 n=1 Tax=Megalops atlanticus TaxID=7932 RepID=A0A9D3PGX3_MEGAT|nr:hypothetical protein MATL_G00224780 [Megalops atlanticus]